MSTQTPAKTPSKPNHPPPPPPPRAPLRGGILPVYRFYVGGASLTTDYKLSTPRTSFKNMLQSRTLKLLASIESSLHTALNSSTAITFKGNLDTTTITAASTELNKEQFLLAVRRAVSSYGLQTFFYLPNADGTAMVCLLDNPHLHTIESILVEYTSRLDMPAVVFESDGTTETAASAFARNRSYDDFELYDLALSRLVIEVLVHPELRAIITTRYDHYNNFDELPGQLYFMFALDACHASNTLDITKATTAFNALALTSFPGEDVNAFAVAALKQIKIMMHGWAVPYNTGLTLLLKVSETETDFFNCKVFALMDKAMEMEDTCGPSGDPRALTSHADYVTYGPIGLCGALQSFYGTLVKKNAWKATAANVPEGNLANVAPGSRRRNPNGGRCNHCGSAFHFVRDCPDNDLPAAGASTGGNNGGGSNGGGDAPRDVPATSAWRYVAPPDHSVPLIRNGTTYWYCVTCTCRRTGRVGFYNRTHPTSKHGQNRAPAPAPAPAPSGAPNPDPAPSPAPAPAPSGAPNPAPAGNLSPVEEIPHEDDLVDTDPDGLIFQGGAYLASDGAWMASVDDDDTEDLDAVTAAVGAFTLLDPDAASASTSNSDAGIRWWYCDGCDGGPGDYMTACDCEGGSFSIPYFPTASDCDVNSDSSPSSGEEVADSDSSDVDARSDGNSNDSGDSDITPTTFCALLEQRVVPEFRTHVREYADRWYSLYKLRLELEEDTSVDFSYLDDGDQVSADLIYWNILRSVRDLQSVRPGVNFSLVLDKYGVLTPTYTPDSLSVIRLHPNCSEMKAVMAEVVLEDGTHDWVPMAHIIPIPAHNPQDDIGAAGPPDSVEIDDKFLDALEEEPDPDINNNDSSSSVVGYPPIAYFDCQEEFPVPVNQSTSCWGALTFWSILYSLVFGTLAVWSTLCSIPTLLSATMTSVWNFVSAVSEQLCLPFVTVSLLFWDSIRIYSHPFKLTRRLRRSKPTTLGKYPRRWMILSAYMLFLHQGFLHPASAIVSRVLHTHHRSLRLCSLVSVTPSVLVQLQRQEAALTYAAFHPEVASSTPPPAVPKTVPSPSVPPDNLSYFDSSAVPLPDIYFDCYEQCDSSVLEGEDGIDNPSSSSFDWLHLRDICDSIFHVQSTIDLEGPSVQTISPHGLSRVLGLDLDPMANAVPFDSVDLFPLGSSLGTAFPVIFDTGASLAISPLKSDFAGPIRSLPSPRRLGGMANGLPIEGVGDVRWGFKMEGKLLVVQSRCYYVPGAKARLISPQRLFNKRKGVPGRFIVTEDNATLEYTGVGSLTIDYDLKSHLPIAYGRAIPAESIHANLAVLNEENQNLTPSQKLLLHWHQRFGHKGMQAVQYILRHAPFESVIFKPASRCTNIPRCEVCEYSKAHRRPTHGAKQSRNPTTDGSLKHDHLRPGAQVSVDHFESRMKGRTLQSRGGPNAPTYVGGCVFVDHMSGYLHVEPQHGFSGSETIRAKQDFEQMALSHGVLIDSYLADNGVFKANAFVQKIREHNQKMNYCGVNAHHKNAVAERSIRTVSECARALLLHAALHWKDGIDSSLWPLAVEYAAYLYNHLPSSSGIAPVDLFTGVQSPRHKLRDIHVWGAPVYVLDPTLQQGKKLPRWQPRSRRGIFVGFSRVHSSDVPLILNPQTGHISPQYHVVFDDEFSTVVSLGASEEPPSFWNDLCLDEATYDRHVYRVPLEPNSTTTLADEWLTPQEREEKYRQSVRLASLRQSFRGSTPSSSNGGGNAGGPGGVPSANPTPPDPGIAPAPLEVPSPSTPAPTQVVPPDPAPSSPPSRPQRVRRSPDWYVPVHCAAVDTSDAPSHEANLAYSADLHTDFDTGEIHCTDPRAFAAKHKLNDPDMPSFSQALSSPHATEWGNAVKKEIRQLIRQNTWEYVPRSAVPAGHPVLKGTWAMKLKRLPDGRPLKFKARYCVRGDLQRKGIDFFDTYAPVVQWSTVRLALTLILKHQWTTKQVDYTNAFAQAKLKETVYVESPRGFARADGKDMVLRLIQSLYGLRQAPRTFFEKLQAGLLERGFTQSNIDSCLFMKHNMIVVVYVDDTIVASPDPKAIEDLITSLGVTTDEQRHTFELRDEGEVGDFLGIRIEKKHRDTFLLTQPGLTKKVLETAKMSDCHAVRTPALTTPIHNDADGEDFSEPWEYATVMGMLMYLANNSRPDIAYAVHQCARFTHQPKASHAAAVKRILRYLKGTADKGLFISPTDDLTVNCYVDADFAGQWASEDPQLPVSVKSRSGHLIMFMGCPLVWQSKLQTQIALSTMEAEYIALSLAMRELIAVREILKEIYQFVYHDVKTAPDLRAHNKSFIPSSVVHEDNQACLQFATMPKMSLRTKHITIPYHFFREKVKSMEVKVMAIDTKLQLADQFTKPLPQDKFENDRRQLMGW